MKLEIKKTGENGERKHPASPLERSTNELSQRLRRLGIANPRAVIAGIQIAIAQLPESELRKIFGDFDIRIIEISEKQQGKGK